MHPKNESLSLDALGVERDPGTEWHPRPDKAEARNSDGNLRDLDDDEVADHWAKPEVEHYVDARGSLAAEDSLDSPEGEV